MPEKQHKESAVSKRANPILNEAIAKHQQGSWQEAEQRYQDILAENPQNADVLHLLGILFGQKGDYKSSKEYLEKALKLSPNNATYHNSMANVKKNLNDIDGAISDYQQAIQLNPQSTTAYNNLAFLLIKQGQLQQAKQHAEHAITLNSQDGESHYNLGLIALKENNPELAITELRNTLLLNPHHLQARYTLAQQLQTGMPEDLDEAITHYESILAAQPDFTDALVNYASALLMQNNDKEALKTFYRALDIDSEHYEANYNLGCALLQQQALNPALEHFIKALGKKPTPEAYYNIGVIYSYQDRHGDAISYLKKAIEFDPLYFAAYNNLGTVYLKIEELNKAIENFSAALKIQPYNEEIAYILSALRQEKTPDRAPKNYVEHLFDQYAPSFDKHLLEHLKYETPKVLHEAVMTQIRDNLHLRKVLDLGCGTGLAGALFKDLASPLIGVDLSSQMIATLQEKTLYDELIVGDLEDALRDHKNNELIIASDVLPYIGDLSPLFHAVQQALTPDGLFAFTIEIAPPDIRSYSLQTSIRYAHSPRYIEQLAAQNQLTLLSQSKITLRLQRNQPLFGLLYILRKGASEAH
jgi:predicted TPR repeat methyltransferase